jgi:thiol:disulfide interchange protein DsbD
MRLDQDQFIVTYDPSRVDEDKILATIKETGYPARVEADGHAIGTTGSATPMKDDPPSFAEARARAKRERKPIVLDFYAEWCVPCKRMSRETFSDPKVKTLLDQCILVEIDTDRYPDLAKRYAVTGLPDIRFLLCDGTEKKKLLDYQDAASFAKALEEVLSRTGGSR